MRRQWQAVWLVTFWMTLTLPYGPVGAAAQADASKPRPMELADVLAWKSINPAVVSNDGRWFAYRLVPVVGDSEVVVRQTQPEKTYRFPVGSSSGQATLAFSDDSAWLAFSVAPTVKELAQLKKQKKPAQTSVRLLNLATGLDVRVDKVRRVAFSGELSTWVALQRYGPDAAAGDAPKGADLILHELSTGTELNVGNVSEFAFDKSGRWLAWIIDAQDQTGNGVELRNMDTGQVRPLDSGKASYERLTWTEKGDALAVLKGIADKRYTDKLYTVVAISSLGSATPQKTTYDPAGDKAFPVGMSISPNDSPTWTGDLSRLLFGIRTVKTAPAKPGEKPDATTDGDAQKPDLVIWHHLDARLPTEQQVQEQADRNFSFLSLYRVNEKRFVRLADESLRTVTPAPKGRWAIGIDVREYERMASLDGRPYQDIYRVDLETGARTLAVKKMLSYATCPLCLQPSPDGSRFLYYDQGQYLVYDMASGTSTDLTRTVPTSFIDLANDMIPAVKPPVAPVGWVKDGGAVLLSDNWDIWRVPIGGGSATNLTVGGRKEGVHYRWLAALDPEEPGLDLALPHYLEMYGERTKKNGIGRLDPGKTGVQVLLWDDAEFARVLKAKRADVYLYTKETYKDPPDYYVTDGMLKAGRKVTDLDAQVKPFAWSSGSQIVEYTAVLGKGGKPQKLQASLFLPANYQKGQSYPTIVRLYEKQSQNHNQFYPPRTTGTGFNKSTYTSNGYAVLMPDIVYNVNDPGMSAVWCVIPAVQAAIKTGVVDPKRIGLHGHSWGGYQTAFLVTQTDMFAAAAAGAPLTDLVSFYSSLFKNRGGSNQPLFENNQARFSGGYWDYRDAFIRNSPVFAARNVKTPLLLNHNDKDGAVDFNQGLEYYNTLRRLGKNVVMLEYVGENHNMAKEANRQDYIVRMKEFFDHYLMDRPAPDWLSKGVPRLEMEDHLDRRLEQPQQPAKPATAQLATVKPTATAARPAPGPQPAAASQRPDLAARVDAVFAQWAKPNSAGCAVAVIKDGAIAYENGYGMSNLEYDLPITPASVFNIASVSKQFTAMAVMVLVSQGKVALDDEARKYVKELPDFGTPVTIRHLLTHTSGLREQMGLLNLAGRGSDVITEADTMELVARQRDLNFKPGAEFMYSNTNYVVLAVLVKRVSGQSLADFAQANIFKPLGMTHTVFLDDHTRPVKNRTSAYVPRGSGQMAIAVPADDLVGPGNLMTTVEDLALWEKNFETGTVGGKAVLDQMTTRAVLNNGRKSDYGFGLMLHTYRGEDVVEHSGGVGGFRAQIMRIPARRFSVACLCNHGTVRPDDLARQVVDIYLGDQLTTPAAAVTKAVTLSAEDLASKAGFYRDPATTSIVKMVLQKGKLSTEGDVYQIELQPLDANRFLANDPTNQTEWVFEPGPGGRPVRVGEKVGDTATVFEAVPALNPTAATLAEYAGTYYSVEVDATFELVVKDGVLVLQRKGQADRPLEPVFADIFMGKSVRTIRFVRDGQRKVTGFGLTNQRIRNLKFVKQGG